MNTSELETLWIENERQRIRTDLFYLCKEYLGYKDLNEELHRPICEKLKEWSDLLVLMPRGTLKSSLITIGKTIQFVLQDQNRRIKIVNANYDKATEFLSEIKQHFQNERLIELFPEILYENPAGQSDLWRENKINVKRSKVVQGPTIEVMGIDTGNIGKHCEIFIVDDPHDDKNTRSFELIQRVKDRINLFISVLEPGGVTIYIGTRWKREDYFEDLIKSGIVYIRKEIIENGKIIFPEKYDEKKLEKLQKKLGTHFYYLQYKNRVLAEEDIQFKEKWFKWFKREKVWSRIYILRDPAIDLKDRACDTVIQTVGQTEDNQLYVIKSDGFKARVQDIVDKLFLEYLKYAKQFEVYVGVEKAGFQHALHQWIEKDQNKYGVFFEVIELEPRGRNKDYRIKRLSPLFERGQIYLHKDNCEELHEQLVEYGGMAKVDHADCLGYLLDMIIEEAGCDVIHMGEVQDPYSLEAVANAEVEMSYLDY